MRIHVLRLRALGLAGIAAAGLLAAACSTEQVMRPDVDIGSVATVPVASAAAPPEVYAETFPGPEMESPPATSMESLPTSEVIKVAYPRLDDPMTEPAPALTMPADEEACRRELERLGVAYADLPRISDGPNCGIDWPVKISAIGSVRMKPAATLSCSMAATFARWTRKELVPAARWRYFSGIKTIHQGSSYSCRNIRGSRNPSQHSLGNALDIMRIELANGRDINVRKPGWFAFRQRGFLKTVRKDGCDYFSTVLGPGYDADHADHFHFDVMPRRNGYVACR